MSNFFTTALHDIEAIPGELAGLFSKHQTAIHNAIADAQIGLTTVAAVAAATESPISAADIAMAVGKVSGILNIAGSLASAEATASTLQQEANNVAIAVNGLSATGVIGTKTQAAVTAAVTKSQTVIGTLVTAAAAVTPAA